MRDGWTPAAVGCHWTKGNHTISTIRVENGTRSGYVVVRHPGIVLGEFVSWDEARELADKDRV